MRNLKKILALVLALVMVVGMMTVATAAKPGTGYTDDAAIVNYDEAIQVLTALGVYRGDDNGNFNPNATITRKEFAAIVYRIVHDDVADKYTSIYADYNKFDDVKSTDWHAGYINYCANGEYILGDGAGNFLPDGKVNGYQVLAVMLRALGYDKEGEFQGAGWEVRTARKAKELGITTTVTEGTLGAPATRALVAELVYRSIAKVSTVQYVKLVGYVKTGSTLAYETFGLQGGTTKLEGNVNETINGLLEYVDYHLYSKADFEAMTERKPAAPDTKYGEPVAYWYSPEVYGGVIEVRFNPVKTFTTKITDADIYAVVAALDPYATGVIPVSYGYIDGVDRTDDMNGKVIAAAVYAANYEDPVDFIGTGNGTVTEIFAVEGKLYAVIKNTYADWVSVAYSKVYKTVLTLTTENASIDYDCGENAWAAEDGYESYVKAFQASNAGLAKGSLVLYHKYGSYVDHTTIHTAPTKTVTLTNSYVEPEEVDSWPHDSYFKVGKDTYSYNYVYNYLNLETNAFASAGVYHEDAKLLDRDMLAEENYTQQIYLDDYGYVIYAENVPAQYAYGYMLVTNATYGGYSNDNGYYMNVKGYDLTGKAMTVKGAFADVVVDPEDEEKVTYADRFVYATKGDAQDYSAEIGLYFYNVDTESGLVSLIKLDLYQDWDDAIMASDPDTLDEDCLVTNETVFAIAKYNKSGLITGYEITKGFKNIDDMKDAEIDAIAGAVKYEYAIEALDLYAGTIYGGFANFVFVMGAKETNDKSYKSMLKDIDEVFFLVNPIPEKQFAEYDLYYVIKDGKLTTMKVDAEEGDQFQAPGFYIVTDENDDYVVECEPVAPATVTYVAEDILGYEGGYLWDYAACNGEYHGEFITLADNAKIIDITTQSEVEADYLYGYTWAGVAAEYNQYGEVTVLYVYGPTGYDF